MENELLAPIASVTTLVGIIIGFVATVLVLLRKIEGNRKELREELIADRAEFHARQIADRADFREEQRAIIEAFRAEHSAGCHKDDPGRTGRGPS